MRKSRGNMKGTTTATIPTAYKPLFWWTTHKTPPYFFYCYEGGRSSGKSTTTGFSLLLRGANQTIRVACFREIQNSIKNSVHQLLKDLITKYNIPGYHVGRETITHTNGTIFIFSGLHDNLQSVKSMEGIDVAWVEEAQSITKESLDILIPTIRKPNSSIIFTWNPNTTTDPIAQRFLNHPTPGTKKRTYHSHTTWKDLNTAGLLSQEILNQINADKHTAEYNHTWEGLPYEQTTSQAVIAWKQVDTATQRPPQTTGTTTLGCDIARYGTDRTAVAIRKGLHLIDIISWTNSSLTHTSDRIQQIAAQYNADKILVDDTGVGGGVTDILEKKGLNVIGINFASNAKQRDKYPNVASELWFDFANIINTVSINPDMTELPNLTQELTTRGWQFDSRGRRMIQAKKDYKSEQDHRSPDLADSVLLAFYEPPTISLQWARG